VLLSHPNELAAAALQAHARIQSHVLCTNLMRSHWLSSVGGCSAFLKMESEQHTNSFKVVTSDHE
jgi:threonine dehydratase